MARTIIDPHWLPVALQLRAHPKFPGFINRLLLHAVTLGEPVYVCDWCGDMESPDDDHDDDCEGFAEIGIRYPSADLVVDLGEASNGSLVFDLLPVGWVAEKDEDEYRCYIRPDLRTSTEQEGYHAGVTLAEAAALAFLAAN